MSGQLLDFGEDVAILLADPLGLVLALGLTLLIRSKVHAALVVINLGLFMELMATTIEPGYQFGTFLSTRVIVSAIQVALAYSVLVWWRHRRFVSGSITAR